jgi:triacylglycerol lipase
MTSFVEILPEEYDANAFEGFDASTADFKLANARALMWFSQLAYETHQKDTINAVFGKWAFKSVDPFSIPKTSLKGSFETCGLIGERDDAVILAFAGTDPGIWQNLATDFTPLPRAGLDMHGGFVLAAEAAKDKIAQAATQSQASRKPLFIAGHSLGAALAALAAQKVLSPSMRPRAVYGFGMPRVGGTQFQASYDAALGAITYRLVHGDDLVARVPPSSIGFHHVGRSLQCNAGAKFDPLALAQMGQDRPAFSDGLGDIFVRGVGNVVSGNILSAAGPGSFGPMFQFLPPDIRDHLQDSYWKALAP